MFTPEKLPTAFVALALSCVAISHVHAQELPAFQLVGTNEVTEIRGSTIIPGGAAGWRADDPSKARGLVVTLKMTFPAGVRELDSSALALSWQGSSGEQRAACLGVTLQGSWEKGGQWFITDPERGTSLNLSAQGPELEASFLFGLPPTVTTMSVIYKGQTVLKSIPLRWK
jgi:hypothetical protein